MSCLIIGSHGSMGTRYKAILRYLDQPFWCVDKEHSLDLIKARADKAEKIILCTPTDTHHDLLNAIISFQKPILCEKPISKNLAEVYQSLEKAKKFSTKFTMMLQYSELVADNLPAERSSYNYFRTGNDGLIWDCLQIIGLAKGSIDIKNDSPVWKCTVNGKALSLSDMDYAYVNFVRKWVTDVLPEQNSTVLYQMHSKTEKLNNERKFQFN